jgi:hypothetical protein
MLKEKKIIKQKILVISPGILMNHAARHEPWRNPGFLFNRTIAG